MFTADFYEILILGTKNHVQRNKVKLQIVKKVVNLTLMNFFLSLNNNLIKLFL